jgi:hypothetical protein
MAEHGPLKAPPFNFLLGTIPGLVEAFKASPMDAHPMTIITTVYRKLDLGVLYFMDNCQQSVSANGDRRFCK